MRMREFYKERGTNKSGIPFFMKGNDVGIMAETA